MCRRHHHHHHVAGMQLHHLLTSLVSHAVVPPADQFGLTCSWHAVAPPADQFGLTCSWHAVVPPADQFGLTCLEVSLIVSLVSSACWSVIFQYFQWCYDRAFCLYVATSFFCIPVIFFKTEVIFSFFCSLCVCFIICPSVTCSFLIYILSLLLLLLFLYWRILRKTVKCSVLFKLDGFNALLADVCVCVCVCARARVRVLYMYTHTRAKPSAW